VEEFMARLFFIAPKSQQLLLSMVNRAMAAHMLLIFCTLLQRLKMEFNDDCST
jgi:hypothetical protein